LVKPMNKSMIRRLLTILPTLPIVVACVYFGGVAFLLLILVLALICINEFYNMMKAKDFHPAYWVGNFFTIFFIVFAYYALKKNWEPAHSALLTGTALVTLVSTLFLKRSKEAIVDIAVTLLGMIYIGWFFSYLLFVRALTERGAYLLFLMGTIWALDIVAYLFGSRFGKRKLLPSVSPKKSVEGAIAGFLFCLVAASVFGYFAGFDLIHSLVLGAIIGVVAQMSDLVESLIKRDAGVKDASSIMPGHGGVLDRMDSFILTTPVVYYYLVWVVLK
jgi:phosphatidate cytidylyltransferase